MQVLGHGSQETVVEPNWFSKMVADEEGKMGYFTLTTKTVFANSNRIPDLNRWR